MNLIIGLGNPGDKYASTRHNIGFMIVDKTLQDLVPSGKTWEFKPDFNAFIFKNGDLIFAKPQTFMNASGMAVAKLANFYHVNPQEIWVVHDDIDLPLGKIKIKAGGGSAGHHGINSLIQQLKSDVFVRFRFGIGRGTLNIEKTAKVNLVKHNIEKYVVSPFVESEAGELRKIIKLGSKAIQTALHKGIDKAMNVYN
jgi:PTH1 family peptidyl-tRNA hydrolase